MGYNIIGRMDVSDYVVSIGIFEKAVLFLLFPLELFRNLSVPC